MCSLVIALLIFPMSLLFSSSNCCRLFPSFVCLSSDIFMCCSVSTFSFCLSYYCINIYCYLHVYETFPCSPIVLFTRQQFNWSPLLNFSKFVNCSNVWQDFVKRIWTVEKKLSFNTIVLTTTLNSEYISWV